MRTRLFFVAIAAGALLWALGPSTAAYQVTIDNFTFAPATVTVPAGAQITWLNRDDEPHKVVSTGGAFAASPVLDTGEHYSVSLAKPGTYDYYCSMHPKMTGKIVVTPR